MPASTEKLSQGNSSLSSSPGLIFSSKAAREILCIDWLASTTKLLMLKDLIGSDRCSGLWSLDILTGVLGSKLLCCPVTGVRVCEPGAWPGEFIEGWRLGVWESEVR